MCNRVLKSQQEHFLIPTKEKGSIIFNQPVYVWVDINLMSLFFRVNWLVDNVNEHHDVIPLAIKSNGYDNINL